VGKEKRGTALLTWGQDRPVGSRPIFESIVGVSKRRIAKSNGSKQRAKQASKKGKRAKGKGRAGQDRLDFILISRA
jgi:hypothetical protein